MEEEVRRGHRNLQVVIGKRLLEFFDDFVSQRRAGINRHEIIVVEVYAIRSQLGKLFDNAGGRNRGTNGVSKRITPSISHSPEAEGKTVGWFGLIRICHSD